MLTGDHPTTARAIAGLSSPEVLTGDVLRELAPERRSQLVARADVIARATADYDASGVLATNSLGGLAAAKVLDDSVKVGTFDLGPDVLKAVEAGEIGFAVDQQPYLQGYLPIEMLALKARYGIFPSEGDVVATGPHFVTRGDAAQALELSERSIR